MKIREKHIMIAKEIDIVSVINEAKGMAEEVGFKKTQQYAVATAASELARNIFKYAGKGKITIRIIEKKDKRGIEVTAEDCGPGIKDIGKALEGGFSTTGGLGLGLSGAKRLMNEFSIDMKRKVGTKVTVRKWV